MKKTFFALQIGKFNISLGRDVSTTTGGVSGGGGVYQGGQINRLNQDWIPSLQTGDAAIRNDLRLMRARCRELERDEVYVRKFLLALENNVLGHQGISLAMDIKDPNGTKDLVANNVIGEGWERWGKRQNCTIAQDDDWLDVQKLIIRSVARDGGILLKKIRGRNVNEFGFALQVLEIDYLDINYSTILPNGNYVYMGVEKNFETRRIVGYWLLKRHPGETFFGAWPYNRYFVPADEIIHVFIKERSTQSVGVPWFCSAMTRLNMLKGYEEAELTAAREAAVKGGFFVSAKGETYTGERDDDGNTLDDLSPGQHNELPAGMTYIPNNPTHPTSQYPDFTEAVLREVAAGVGLAYATLTGDLSQVNFSSGRMGWLEEREMFKVFQSFMIRKAIVEAFEPWLESSMLMNVFNIDLPMSKFNKFNAPKFRGRRWPWVDPLTDIKAAGAAINLGIETRQQHVEEHQDRNTLEETFDQLEYEKELADEKGLTFTDPSKGGGADNKPEPDNEDGKPKNNGKKRFEVAT